MDHGCSSESSSSISGGGSGDGGRGGGSSAAYARLKSLGRGAYGEALLVERTADGEKLVIKEVCVCVLVGVFVHAHA